MRLLNTYTLELEERFDNIPPYAILSHTWGEEEVTFQDINDGSGRQKRGWSKIQNCCKIAKRYGYEYAWVDTCCIDKSSSSELTEAINSMFNWYLNSSVCYVFLEDLHDKVISEKDKLRWFSRGWTLQELIAPGKLRFRNSQWEYVGTRRELSPVINHITGIPTNILEHKGDIIDRLSRKSIAERMSWAAGRITKRSEDRAYSLMGLFSINMPLLYGEGGANAFFRLQEAIMKKSMDRSILCCLPPASLVWAIKKSLA
ncbi:HET-domain-containing protein [Corynespora cassiicola Philippines]|uniref:HET-domain-containing protein n=1 Tax=Corynespora cassiicola Philippines TaxID=1448308 RepID=A0A2T2P8F9_CORCC|nr:HET-domain-containing protein [Corynespora cassiicola Philippines]